MKMEPIFILALLALLMTLWTAIEITIGIRKMRLLADVPPLTPAKQPKVSIVVAACNEEKSIERAARSLLNQEYANFEVVIVNDRSTDGTGRILEKLRKEFPRLLVHQIDKLPPGWLGKTNALHQGAKLASGEYLLFTDADVVMEKTTLSRAAFLVKKNALDHLSLFFKNTTSGALLNALIIDASGGLLFLFKPWKAKDPKSKKFVGVGAFNLVKKSAYESIGGHGAVRMHPIDDIMLGKNLKRSGFRQDCLLGNEFVTVRWYESAGAMIQGLMKNVFALYNFKVSYVLASILVIVLGSVAPLWFLIFAGPKSQAVSFLAIAARFYSFSQGAKAMDAPAGLMFWSLITPYINMYIILKATFTTLKNKGITWRGTFYPLTQHRKNDPIL